MRKRPPLVCKRKEPYIIQIQFNLIDLETIKDGERVDVLNMSLVEDIPTGRLILNVLLALAEFERDMIVERTQEGKAIAKLDPNFHEGRPRICGKGQIEHVLKLKETPA